jgi:hypothetical protein
LGNLGRALHRLLAGFWAKIGVFSTGFQYAPIENKLAHGVSPYLNCLVAENALASHFPVLDKSKRQDSIFSREDSSHDKDRDIYICLVSKTLKTTRGLLSGETKLSYPTSTYDGRQYPFNFKCCATLPHCEIPRDIYEVARDVARVIAKPQNFVQTRSDSKKVKMLFAHLKCNLICIGSGRKRSDNI